MPNTTTGYLNDAYQLVLLDGLTSQSGCCKEVPTFTNPEKGSRNIQSKAWIYFDSYSAERDGILNTSKKQFEMVTKIVNGVIQNDRGESISTNYITVVDLAPSIVEEIMDREEAFKL